MKGRSVCAATDRANPVIPKWDKVETFDKSGYLVWASQYTAGYAAAGVPTEWGRSVMDLRFFPSLHQLQTWVPGVHHSFVFVSR
jgi:hypothetical protein